MKLKMKVVPRVIITNHLFQFYIVTLKWKLKFEIVFDGFDKNEDFEFREINWNSSDFEFFCCHLSMCSDFTVSSIQFTTDDTFAYNPGRVEVPQTVSSPKLVTPANS